MKKIVGLVSVAALLPLTAVGVAAAAESPPAEGFPSFADVVPDGADYTVDDWVRESSTLKADGLPLDPYHSLEEVDWLSKGSWVGDAYVEVFPESVTVTFRSNLPDDSFQVWASPVEQDHSSPDQQTIDERMDLVGTADTGGSVTASFPSEQVRQLGVRADQPGQVSVLVHSEYADPGPADRYEELHIDFGYSWYSRAVSNGGSFELYVEDHEVVGQTMDLSWYGASIGRDTPASITIAGPEGWSVYTGNGSSSSSPAQTVSGAALFEPSQPGVYTVTVAVGDDSVTVPMRADETLDRNRWPGPVTPPSEECVRPTLPGAGPMEDPQLLVNGQMSNDVTVAVGQPVTFGWSSSHWDGSLDTFVSVEHVWGPSPWQSVGPSTNIPVPDAGAAEATITFNEPGCNLLRMSYSLDGERYAYVTVEQAEQPPAAPEEPTVDVNRKTATINWAPVDGADEYTVTIEGLAPITTVATEIEVDLSPIAKGKDKSFPALITATNSAGTSGATEFVVSLKESSGDGPGHGNGNTKPDKPGKPNKQ